MHKINAKQTSKDLFINQMENKILTGQLNIGDQLPTERELAKEFNVSKSNVNLGIAELNKKGFIEVIPRQGSFVIDYTKFGTLNTLISIVNFNDGLFDKKNFYSLMEFRLNNEVAGAGLCAKNRTTSDIADLETIYQKILNSSNAYNLSELLFNFHHRILCSTGNTIYPLVYNSFKNLIIQIVAPLFEFHDASSSITLLRSLLDAIIEKDVLKSQSIMSLLLSQGIDNLENNYFSRKR